PIGPGLVQRLAGVAPRLAGQIRTLTGVGKVKARFVKRSKNSPVPFSYDVTAELHGGTVTHPKLPMPLEQIEAMAQLQDGRMPTARLSARSGKATLDLNIRDANLSNEESAGLENVVGEMDMRIEHLPVTPALFASLAPEAQDIQRDYKPTGTITVSHSIR